MAFRLTLVFEEYRATLRNKVCRALIQEEILLDFMCSYFAFSAAMEGWIDSNLGGLREILGYREIMRFRMEAFLPRLNICALVQDGRKVKNLLIIC